MMHSEVLKTIFVLEKSCKEQFKMEERLADMNEKKMLRGLW